MSHGEVLSVGEVLSLELVKSDHHALHSTICSGIYKI